MNRFFQKKALTLQRTVILGFLFPFTPFFLIAFANAQLHEIDASKLPQDQSVQEAYSNAQSVEIMTRAWSQTWKYDTPKAQVVSILTSSLHNLESAKASAPLNEELLLLTGLVAHFGYNVDIDNTYDVAVHSFEEADKLAPHDYRAKWFLAAHRCQSNELTAGMQQMLFVEDQTSWRKLPLDFWHDYINCSIPSGMPAHTLRAVDRAVQLGEDPTSYRSAVDISRNRYTPTDLVTTYAARDAWDSENLATNVQFSSDLCGIGLSVHGDWRVDLKDVTKGTCALVVEPGPYPSKTGDSTPSIMLLSRAPKDQEKLSDFAGQFLKPYPSAHMVTAPSCPSDKCLAFEITSTDMYQSEGGAHLMVVVFAGQPPKYPALLFEKPLALPRNEPGKQVTYYRPSQRLHRLPGTLYTVVLLDSNESIFEKASADFRFLLKSIQLD